MADPTTPRTTEGEWQPMKDAPKTRPFLCCWQAPKAEKPQIIVAQWAEFYREFVGVNVQDGDGRGTVSSLRFGSSPAPYLFAMGWMDLPVAMPPDTRADRPWWARPETDRLADPRDTGAEGR